jgi:hypothetical protein
MPPLDYINRLKIEWTFRHVGIDPASRKRPDSSFHKIEYVQIIMRRLIRLVITYPALHLTQDDIKPCFYAFTSSPPDHDLGYPPILKTMMDK